MRYPNLELIECKFNNRIVSDFKDDIKSLGDYRFRHRVYVFPQLWGSTVTGFDIDGSCGGSAMTEEYTTVVEKSIIKLDGDFTQFKNIYYGVFFGNKPAYILKNPNERFLKDLSEMYMQPQSTSYLYFNNADDAEIIIVR